MAVIGLYPTWINDVPVCPKCNNSEFFVSYNEEIVYDVSITNGEVEFSDHEHAGGNEPYLEYVGCRSCDIDIVIDSRLRDYFSQY